MTSAKGTANYRIVAQTNGNRYKFYCGISGALGCTTSPYLLASPEEELLAAWTNEGKQHFNYCEKCGRWVIDAMFNADVLKCVDCAPWEDEPLYCIKCGTAAHSDDIFCRKCSTRLRYGGDEA